MTTLNESSAIMESADQERLMRRLIWRIVPLVTAIYLFAIIDRGNIGFAKLQMAHDLGLSEAAFGFGASLFFVGYLVFEVPSAMLQTRFGARVWLARIVGTWGLLTMALAFANSTMAFYSLRLLLGLAEAGAYPGIILYLTQWFPAAYRVRVLALLTLGSALGNMLGSLMAGALLDLNGTLGLQGWQWIFLLTGLPAVLLCGLTLWLLPDKPATARFLKSEERTWLAAAISLPDSAGQEHGRGLIAALLQPQTLLLAFMYTMIMMSLYGVIYWLPSVVHSFGYKGTANGLISAIPWAVTAVALPIASRNIRTESAVFGAMIVYALVGLLAFGLCAIADDKRLQLLALAIGTPCISLLLPNFWFLPSRLFTGAQAAVCIASISSVGALGGFGAQNAMPAVALLSGSPVGAMLVPSTCLVTLLVCTLLLRFGGLGRRKPHQTPAPQPQA
jgi:MFS family permease